MGVRHVAATGCDVSFTTSLRPHFHRAVKISQFLKGESPVRLRRAWMWSVGHRIVIRSDLGARIVRMSGNKRCHAIYAAEAVTGFGEFPQIKVNNRGNIVQIWNRF